MDRHQFTNFTDLFFIFIFTFQNLFRFIDIDLSTLDSSRYTRVMSLLIFIFNKTNFNDN